MHTKGELTFVREGLKFDIGSSRILSGELNEKTAIRDDTESAVLDDPAAAVAKFSNGFYVELPDVMKKMI